MPQACEWGPRFGRATAAESGAGFRDDLWRGVDGRVEWAPPHHHVVRTTKDRCCLKKMYMCCNKLNSSSNAKRQSLTYQWKWRSWKALNPHFKFVDWREFKCPLTRKQWIELEMWPFEVLKENRQHTCINWSNVTSISVEVEAQQLCQQWKSWEQEEFPFIQPLVKRCVWRLSELKYLIETNVLVKDLRPERFWSVIWSCSTEKMKW